MTRSFFAGAGTKVNCHILKSCSFLYLLLPTLGVGNIINSVGATDGLSYLQTCFYHSTITFLTIGYGDYYPTGFSRGISIVEGWMGLFLMSYFTVAFVRKIVFL